MADPGKSHVEFVRDIIKYMNGSADQLMAFTKRNDWGSIKRGALADIVGFFDSDFAADVNTRRSRTGWSVYIFGMPIGHKSVLQHSITLSTASAEFLAMCSLMQFMMWFVGLVQEIGFRIKDKVLILGDNRACMHIAKNPVHTNFAKHIDIRLRFVRQILSKGESIYAARWLQTDDNVGDACTKCLARVKFTRFRDLMLGHTDIYEEIKGDVYGDLLATISKIIDDEDQQRINSSPEWR